jgi:hypothetical protein
MTTIEAHLRELEEKLLQLVVRRDPEAVSALLTDDFREFGSSGRIFNKQQILLALQESPSQLSLRDFQATTLAPDVALVTYRAIRSHNPEQSAVQSLHSSIWAFRNARWQMVFHQGTKLLGDS